MQRVEPPLLGDRTSATALAEGDLVRSTNDMYKEYGMGRVQKVRRGQVAAREEHMGGIEVDAFEGQLGQ